MSNCKNAAIDTCEIGSETCAWISELCPDCKQYYKISRVVSTGVFMIKDHKKICMGRKR